MAIHSIEHVQERDGDYFVGATRITLGSAIAAWQQSGERPEGIIEAFPAVSRADAYGAIAFYLDHRPELDQLFAEQLREFERMRAESQAANPEFYADMRRRMEALRATGWLRQEEESLTPGDTLPQSPDADAPEGNRDRGVCRHVTNVNVLDSLPMKISIGASSSGYVGSIRRLIF